VNAKLFLVAAIGVMLLANCSRSRSRSDPAELRKFAQRYAKAWSSHDPEKVAAFYVKNGLISVNGGPPTPNTERNLDVATDSRLDLRP